MFTKTHGPSGHSPSSQRRPCSPCTLAALVVPASLERELSPGIACGPPINDGTLEVKGSDPRRCRRASPGGRRPEPDPGRRGRRRLSRSFVRARRRRSYRGQDGRRRRLRSRRRHERGVHQLDPDDDRRWRPHDDSLNGGLGAPSGTRAARATRRWSTATPATTTPSWAAARGQLPLGPGRRQRRDRRPGRPRHAALQRCRRGGDREIPARGGSCSSASPRGATSRWIRTTSRHRVQRPRRKRQYYGQRSHGDRPDPDQPRPRSGARRRRRPTVRSTTWSSTARTVTTRSASTATGRQQL